MARDLEHRANGCVFLANGWISRLAEAVAADAEFQHIARWTDLTVELRAPAGTIVLTVQEASLAEGAVSASGEHIRLAATAERWRAFFSPTPPPWHNDMLGFSRRHDDVDLDPSGTSLMRNLRVLNRLWEVAREID